jgi:hypothetical protein
MYMVVCKRQQGEENDLVKSAISEGTREAPWIPRSLPSADNHGIILPAPGQEVSHLVHCVDNPKASGVIRHFHRAIVRAILQSGVERTHIHTHRHIQGRTWRIMRKPHIMVVLAVAMSACLDRLPDGCGGAPYE